MLFVKQPLASNYCVQQVVFVGRNRDGFEAPISYAFCKYLPLSYNNNLAADFGEN